MNPKDQQLIVYNKKTKTVVRNALKFFKRVSKEYSSNEFLK